MFLCQSPWFLLRALIFCLIKALIERNQRNLALFPNISGVLRGDFGGSTTEISP